MIRSNFSNYLTEFDENLSLFAKFFILFIKK